MLSLTVLFWMFVILFAVIGMMRGWAKEILVSFSVILAIFIVVVMEKVPFVTNAISGAADFWFRFIVVLVLVFFGYQSPNLPRLAGLSVLRANACRTCCWVSFWGLSTAISPLEPSGTT